MKIKNIFSPNYSKKKRPAISLKFIIIHYTGMQSERESTKRLCNLNSKVSCHYLINYKGKVSRLVQDRCVAWHAGKSCWGRYRNLNENSIGVELVNRGHKFGYTNYKKKQISNLVKLCQILVRKHKIKKKNILGHSDIAPLRKIDPGEKFPWKYLAKNKLGIWHDYESNFLKKYRKKKFLTEQNRRKFFNNLNKIGYCFAVKNKSFFVKTIKAFQRHFRKELIDGILDQECFMIAQNLTKKL